MIIAVASILVIFILILYPLTVVFTPALGNYAGYELGSFIAFPLSAIIVGYMFTQKIWEEKRTKTITKIAVLLTVVFIFMVYMEYAATDWTPMVKEDYMKANPTANPSAFDWYMIETLTLTMEKFLDIVLVLAFSFIGLYIGSTLKKPTKT